LKPPRITLTHAIQPSPRSIHPQGWVPVETRGEVGVGSLGSEVAHVAFTPKGGCPLKLTRGAIVAKKSNGIV